MRIEPYVFFDGRCDEAIEFYTAFILRGLRITPSAPHAAEQSPVHESE